MEYEYIFDTYEQKYVEVINHMITKVILTREQKRILLEGLVTD